jgi:hypothetical protein
LRSPTAGDRYLTVEPPIATAPATAAAAAATTAAAADTTGPALAETPTTSVRTTTTPHSTSVVPTLRFTSRVLSESNEWSSRYDARDGCIVFRNRARGGVELRGAVREAGALTHGVTSSTFKSQLAAPSTALSPGSGFVAETTQGIPTCASKLLKSSWL